MNYNMINIVYMTVFHADFISVTLGRLRAALHIAIKNLPFCLAVLHSKKLTFSTGRSIQYPLKYKLQGR